MNFSYFTTTDQPLTQSRNAMVELLHNLMFTQAALQLFSNQKTWDVLLPIYLGDPEQRFDRNLLTALMIQVGQRNNPYFITEQNYGMSFPVGTPVITLILDLGVDKAEISSIGSFREDVFGFKISGLGTEIYKCLEKSMVKPLKSLLEVSTAVIQDEAARRNMRFRYHTWNERFPSLNTDRKDIDADGEPGDTTAASSAKSSLKRKGKEPAAIQDEVASRNTRFSHHTWSDRFPSLNTDRKDIDADGEPGDTTAASSAKSSLKGKRKEPTAGREKGKKGKKAKV